MANPYSKGLHLLPMADRIEADARDNLTAWAMLGQTDKYTKAMQQVRILRHAETMHTISERRGYLNAHGVYL